MEDSSATNSNTNTSSTPRRQPLSDSTNSRGQVRLVPATPPRLLRQKDDVYGRSPLPSHPSHILAPGFGKNRAAYDVATTSDLFQQRSPATALSPSSSGSSSRYTASNVRTATGSPAAKPKPLPRQRLQIHKDSKTFSLVPLDQSDSVEETETLRSPRSPTLSSKSSFTSLRSVSRSTDVHSLSILSNTTRPTSTGSETGEAPYTSVLESKRFTPTADSRHFTPTSDTKNSTPTSEAESYATPIPESKHYTPAPETKQTLSPDAAGSSPWNYQFVGGLRKVPKSPDLQRKSSVRSESTLPSLPEISDAPVVTTPDLYTKLSFPSDESVPAVPKVTVEKRDQGPVLPSEAASKRPVSSHSNFEILGSPSPEPSVLHRPQTESSSEENYEILGASSPAPVVRRRPQTESSEENYEILGASSPAPAAISRRQREASEENYEILGSPSPESSVIHRPQTDSASDEENYEILGRSPAASDVARSPASHAYSQESLVVPPLQPRTRRSNENLGYYKSRSRESLRSGSLTSISTSFGQQEASQAIVGSGALINLPALNPRIKFTTSWAETLNAHPLRSQMQDYTHQWSSQLSTVPSVSEGTDRDSRTWSSGEPGKRTGSRMVSTGSTAIQEETQSRGGSIEPPQQAHMRALQRRTSNSSFRVVGNQDEYGDGLTDLEDLPTRLMRTRLYGGAPSDDGRSNTMRSISSTRTANLLASTIPTWAKVYYGSGERRYMITRPGTSSTGSISRASSFRTLRSGPSVDEFPMNIYVPRRRPREIEAHEAPADRVSLEITPVTPRRQRAQSIAKTPQGDDGFVNNPNPAMSGFRTWSMSSRWSPHLKLDRRAGQRSAWEAPSLSWSAVEGGMFERRNTQIIMFIVGFVFPFAWMIAAFLPIPPNPMAEMEERDHSAANLDSSNRGRNEYTRQFGAAAEKRHESARWWRNLNRCMSIVGIFIIAIVIVLAVVSAKRGL